jgi:hypothetical protein
MEYSKLVQGTVTSLGGATPVVLPFVPDFVEVDNFTAATTPANGGVVKGLWYSGMGQGTGLRYVFNATPVLTTSTLSSGGISTFSAGTPQLGSALAISGITKASAAVVTTTGNHGLVTGNVVILTGLFQSSTTGMPQISNIPFVITVTGATTFTIPFNTNQSNYTALSGSPAGAYVRQVLYPYLYFPGVNVITAITTGATTTITTAANHNLVVGQQVSFYIPSQWGTVELTSPNSLGQQVTGFVTSVTNATTVVVGINTASGYTAFNSNPTVAQALAGMSVPQMLSVGDNNTGAVTNSFLPSTINSSTIGGAFQNNTRQGFIIGASLAGTAADVLYYRAYVHDDVN